MIFEPEKCLFHQEQFSLDISYQNRRFWSRNQFYRWGVACFL